MPSLILGLGLGTQSPRSCPQRAEPAASPGGFLLAQAKMASSSKCLHKLSEKGCPRTPGKVHQPAPQLPAGPAPRSSLSHGPGLLPQDLFRYSPCQRPVLRAEPLPPISAEPPGRWRSCGHPGPTGDLADGRVGPRLSQPQPGHRAATREESKHTASEHATPHEAPDAVQSAQIPVPHAVGEAWRGSTCPHQHREDPRLAAEARGQPRRQPRSPGLVSGASPRRSGLPRAQRGHPVVGQASPRHCSSRGHGRSWSQSWREQPQHSTHHAAPSLCAIRLQITL